MKNVVVFLLGFLFSKIVFAQEQVKPVTRTYAIRNATIIPAPGKKIDKGTIIIRNGLIVSVGKDSKIPTDAHIIEGDSLIVYAGFIDGFSQVGVKEEKKDTDTQRNKPKNPGSPADEVAGIQPEVSVTNIEPNNASLETMRKIGFTTAHVFPKGRFIAGKGSVVLLGAESSAKMLLKNDISLCVQFVGAGNVYPSNELGMMAKFKQLYREATYTKKHEELYAQNASGMVRPERNKTVEAFYPIIDKKAPVFFKADKLLDAQKALELQRELGFSIVLADVKEGWLLADKIKSSKAGVFLSLSLPEEQKETAKKDSTSQKTPTSAEEEMARLKKRQEESAKLYLSQAATLQKAGIRFGFSTLGAKPENIRKNFKRMMDNGLSEEALLAALTTYPAELLGISSIAGTLDAGKMANLFVATKPFYDEKCLVRYVFVDGILYEYKEKSTAKKDPTAKINPVGTWKYSTESPQGKNEGNIVIKGGEGNWSGTMSFSFNGETADLADIKLDGNELSFNVTLNIQGNSLTMRAVTIIKENTMTGELDTQRFGKLPLNAEKQPE